MRTCLSNHLTDNRKRKWGRRAANCLLVTICCLSVQPALAHDGRPPAPHDLWQSWNLEPSILLGLILTGWFYGRGLRNLWPRAGVGRGLLRRQAAAFAGGLGALFIALVSPLDALSEALFSAHMVQHLLLMLVAAPMIVWGMPAVLMAWALPRRSRRRWAQWWHRHERGQLAWRVLAAPWTAWVFYAAVTWIWHLPRFYQAALQNEFIHLLEHGCFLGASLLFWSVLIQQGGSRRFNYGACILYLFTTAVHSGLLGALMTFAGTPWYTAYSETTAPWGLTPLADQQLAGAIMWWPAGLIYLLAALGALGVWLRDVERREQRRYRNQTMPSQQAKV